MTNRNWAITGRKIRIGQTKELVREHQPLTHEKLLAYMDLEFGLDVATRNGYIKTLVDAGQIRFNPESKQYMVVG